MVFHQFLIDITYIEEFIISILKKTNNKNASRVVLDKLKETKDILKILRIDDQIYAKELYCQLFKTNNSEEFQKIINIKKDNGFRLSKRWRNNNSIFIISSYNCITFIYFISTPK